MYFLIPQFLLLASLASAHRMKLVTGEQAFPHELVARQVAGYSNCSVEDSCGKCFGEGYVLCDNKGCFNPDKGQKCCKGGTLCVGWDNSCCGPNRAGVTGTDGPVPVPTDGSMRGPDTTGGWTCTRSDGNEGCCSKGGPDIHWCSGDFPHHYCYNVTNQVCCSEGTVCSGKDCCKIVNAVETTPAPYASLITSALSSKETSDTASDTKTGGATATDSESETSTSTDRPAATTTERNAAGGVMNMAGSVVVVMLGAFGLVWL